jgi:hypothetical protein
MRSVVALILTAFASGCATSTPVILAENVDTRATTPVEIHDVAALPKTLDLSAGAVVSIRWTQSGPGRAQVDIVDASGHVVRRIDTGEHAAGVVTAAWDGRTDEGPACEDVYRYMIRVVSADGRVTIHDPSITTGGEELKPVRFLYEDKKNELSWVMPKASRTRLRAGVEDFPHLNTILDWQPFEAGKQVLTWDGLDSSGLIRIKDHPHRIVMLNAFALPDNAILIKNAIPRSAVSPRAENQAEYAPEWKSSATHFHARHPRSWCREPRFDVEFVGVETSAAPQSIATLSGVVPVRVSLADEASRHLLDHKYEVAVYEDTNFVFEEEDAIDPFTFSWDTSRLSPGRHVLTIDIIGYDDHLGVVSRAVEIGAAQ